MRCKQYATGQNASESTWTEARSGGERGLARARPRSHVRRALNRLFVSTFSRSLVQFPGTRICYREVKPFQWHSSYCALLHRMNQVNKKFQKQWLTHIFSIGHTFYIDSNDWSERSMIHGAVCMRAVLYIGCLD